MRVLFILIIWISWFTNLQSQIGENQATTAFDTTIIALEDSLRSLGQTIIQDSIWSQRQSANEKFCQLWEEALSQSIAYDYPFDSLMNVSKLSAPDGSFRLFTWQLFESDDAYVYFGYVLHKDGRVVKLDDKSSDYFTPEFESGDKDHWYGALYYNIVPFIGVDAKTQYLLFGYDGNSLMERRKIIDVMSWSEAGLPIFGAPVFTASADSRAHPPALNRIVLEYFAGAKVKCNYDEIQNQILYDHLVFKKTPYGDFLIPDGSYEGYVYEEGKWKHNMKVFHEVLDAPPFPKPVLNNGRKKDVFGNPSNNKPRPARKKEKNN